MIAIVTDSTAYLTKREADELCVSVVPMTYTVNGRLYNEIYADQNGDYRRILTRCDRCATAQASVSAFMSTFEELLRKDFDILCLTISSRLSGTYSSASIAAREVGNGRITVVDSLSTAGGMLILIKHARALAEKGRTLAEIVGELERIRDRIGIVLTVDDMLPLRRSGRLGIVRQSVGTMLNLRPILRCTQGAVVSDGTARGKNGLLRELLLRIPEDTDEVLVHHIDDLVLAENLKKELRSARPKLRVEQRELGPVLGIHLGVGVLAAVFYRK